MYLYLDESGDFGFNFSTRKPSRYFVITLLALTDARSIKAINNVVTKTLDKKINYRKKQRLVSELKGSATTIAIKKYFLGHMDKHVSNWTLYSIILDKLSLLKSIEEPIKDHIYNQMTYQLLEKIPFHTNKHVNLIVDRSKNNLGIKEFNDYLYANLSLVLNLETKLYISHDCSTKHGGIQAVDMFCYGIARKYELQDRAWYSLYEKKIAVECLFQV